MPKEIHEIIDRIWENGTRPLEIDLTSSGSGELKSPSISIGLTTSKDVAFTAAAVAEVFGEKASDYLPKGAMCDESTNVIKKDGYREFERDDGRTLKVFRTENGGVGIQGTGDDWIFLPKENCAEFLKKMKGHF